MDRSSEQQMEESHAPTAPSTTVLEQLMVRYQQADELAARTLIEQLSPQLYRFFAAQLGNADQAADMLQDAWLRIHRVRHTYRPGEPLLPWIYAIARHVRVDSYRKRRRMAIREIGLDKLPEPGFSSADMNDTPAFDQLIAPLPASQREVLTMLKVNGLSLEEVARATSSSVGSVKQKAHRAYERLRALLDSRQAGKGATR